MDGAPILWKPRGFASPRSASSCSRYQKPDGGFQFRAAFTPVAGSGVLAPWFGVSFDYAW